MPCPVPQTEPSLSPSFPHISQLSNIQQLFCQIQLLSPGIYQNHPSIIGAFCQNRIINFCIGRVGKILFIFSGDEILSINGQVLQGMTHGQAIAVFKNIKEGKVSLHLARRQQPQLPPFSKRSVANHLPLVFLELAGVHLCTAGSSTASPVKSWRCWRSEEMPFCFSVRQESCNG